ncbi:MAG: very short patch repair endonuclease [Minisyncoccales bacterium]
MKTVTKKYLRDGRAPIPKNEKTSRLMSANKGKNTIPEKTLSKALWNSGLRGYLKNYGEVPGKPDIAFKKERIAIFVNGCFWHNCPKCDFPLPKTNRTFWRKKFTLNKRRDAIKIKELHQIGWKTLIIWECEIKQCTDCIVKKISELKNSLANV